MHTPMRYLVSELVLHVFLDASEHERLQYHVQALDLVLVDIAFAFILGMAFYIFRKPFYELIVRVE